MSGYRQKWLFENHRDYRQTMLGVAHSDTMMKVHDRNREEGKMVVCARESCGNEFLQYVTGGKLKIYCTGKCRDKAGSARNRQREREAAAIKRANAGPVVPVAVKREKAKEASAAVASVMGGWGL